jgi:hypothetical protein
MDSIKERQVDFFTCVGWQGTLIEGLKREAVVLSCRKERRSLLVGMLIVDSCCTGLSRRNVLLYVGMSKRIPSCKLSFRAVKGIGALLVGMFIRTPSWKLSFRAVNGKGVPGGRDFNKDPKLEAVVQSCQGERCSF